MVAVFLAVYVLWSEALRLESAPWCCLVWVCLVTFYGAWFIISMDYCNNNKWEGYSIKPCWIANALHKNTVLEAQDPSGVFIKAPSEMFFHRNLFFLKQIFHRKEPNTLSYQQLVCASEPPASCHSVESEDTCQSPA